MVELKLYFVIFGGLSILCLTFYFFGTKVGTLKEKIKAKKKKDQGNEKYLSEFDDFN